MEALSGCLTGHQITKIYVMVWGDCWWGIVWRSYLVTDGVTLQMDFSPTNTLTDV